MALDEKGRMLVPAKIRNEIDGAPLVLTRGIDRCLWLFTREEWKRVSARLIGSTSLYRSRDRMIKRRIIAPALDTDFDKAGRINISVSLREYANLTKECVVLGIENHIEIWDDESYKRYWDENEPRFQQAAEEIGEAMSG